LILHFYQKLVIRFFRYLSDDGLPNSNVTSAKNYGIALFVARDLLKEV